MPPPPPAASARLPRFASANRRARRASRRWVAGGTTVALVVALGAPFDAGNARIMRNEIPPPRNGAPGPDNLVPTDQPITFTADRVEYDREGGLVAAEGRVEAWQAGRVVRADRFTYDRARRVAVLAPLT